MLSLGNDEWRQEILRRTGFSLLSVRGIKRPSGRSKSSREFFSSLVEKNWDGIRLLHTPPCSDQNTKIDEIRWSKILSSLAKHLKSLRLSVTGYAFPSDSLCIPRSNPASVFSNSAPILTGFEISNMYCSTSSLPHLRTFSVKFWLAKVGPNIYEFINASETHESSGKIKPRGFFLSPSNQ